MAFSQDLPSTAISPSGKEVVVVENKPEALAFRKDDKWYYQMTNGTLKPFPEKLKDVKDERIALQRLVETPRFEKTRKLCIIIQPVVQVGLLVTQVMLWFL